MSEEQYQAGDHKGSGQGQQGTLLRAFGDAVQLSGAHVLSGIGGQGHTEGEVGQHDKAIHTHDDNIGGDNGLAEAVGQGLNNDHGSGENHLGQTGGQAQLQGQTGELFFRLQVFQLQVKNLTHAHQLDKAENSGGNLGDDGSQGYTENTQAESRHEPDIQNNVHRRGHQQRLRDDERRALYRIDGGHDVLHADGGDDSSKNEFLFRLEPSAEVNSNWHVNARLDAKVKMTGADADHIISYIISGSYDMAKAVTPKNS